MTVQRPIMRYHGGKWRMASWILSHLPPHRIYIEPFGGAGSILLRKPRSYSEIYNDLASEIVNLFRVLRDPEQSARLQKQVDLTPYSREEFEDSFIPADDPVEQARRTLLRTAASYSTATFGKWGTGFRGNVSRSYSTPSRDWIGIPSIIGQVTQRLQGVVVEHLPALDLIRKYDHQDALFYCDPPYVHSTRNPVQAGNAYIEDNMFDEDHRELLELLTEIKGQVVISGYPSSLYDNILNGWRRVEYLAQTDSHRKKTEVLWISPGRTEHQLTMRI